MAGRIIVPDLRAFDSNGDPLSGAKLYTYTTGTSVNRTTYTTSALSVAHANPVVADSAGRFPDVWATQDEIFRIVVKDSTGATTLYDEDDIVAIGAGTNPAPRALTSVTTLTAEDVNRRISGAGTWTLTLPLGSGLTSGWSFRFANEGTGVITIATSGADLIDAASTKAVQPYQIFDVVWNGTGFETDNVSNGSGRQSIWIPVGWLIPRITSGAGSSLSETTTNRVMRRTLDFDPSTTEYAQAIWRFPKSWDEGAITFVPEWTHGATATNFGVVWALRARAFSNDDPAEAAMGTAQTSTDTGGTTDDYYVGPESSAITIAGSPAAEDLVVFEVYRDPANGSDTMAIDAGLIGITVYFTTNAENDA